MQKDLKITYEPHPVAPERKAELRAEGFRIVDIEFAPPDWIESSIAEEGGQDSLDVGTAEPAALPADELPGDEELRSAIKNATGKAPHWRVKRDALIEQYRALQ